MGEDVTRQTLPPSINSWMRKLSRQEKIAHLERAAAYLRNPAVAAMLRNLPPARLKLELKEKLKSAAQDTDSLFLAQVAAFLAELTYCKKQDLGWLVKQGLQKLGLRPPTAKRGRPRGRPTDHQYLGEVQGHLSVIEELGIWELRQQLKKKLPSRWQTELRRQLKHIRSATIDAVIVSKSKRSLAIRSVASNHRVSYDAVDQAFRRAERQFGRSSTKNQI